jgi:hypothetical protein
MKTTSAPFQRAVASGRNSFFSSMSAKDYLARGFCATATTTQALAQQLRQLGDVRRNPPRLVC